MLVTTVVLSVWFVPSNSISHVFTIIAQKQEKTKTERKNKYEKDKFYHNIIVAFGGIDAMQKRTTSFTSQ